MSKSLSAKKNDRRSSQSSIRIIAGKWRSRLIHFHQVDGLRPTGDRIRETLFNWLSADIVGARCLDAFAGSGALGFEALSRGASEVVFVEKNAAAAKMLEHNKVQLQTEAAIINRFDFLDWLTDEDHGQFDILFLDPPFGAGLYPTLMTSLSESTLIKPGTLIYIESPAKEAIHLPASWQTLKTKHSGAVTYQLIECN